LAGSTGGDLANQPRGGHVHMRTGNGNFRELLVRVLGSSPGRKGATDRFRPRIGLPNIISKVAEAVLGGIDNISEKQHLGS